ncbi:MAG: hypothetical protein AAFU85_11420 [Planctomycetota bacterium]
MAARDDSVIRGSLITCIIFLVLSLALNFFLWSWGDQTAEQEKLKSDQLATANQTIRDAETKIIIYEAMMGTGQLTQDQYDTCASGGFADASLNTIGQQFVIDMGVFSADIGLEGRNYHALPEFFTNTIRERNEANARETAAAEKANQERDQQVATARAAQQAAEDNRDQLARDLAKQKDDFDAERKSMVQKMESARDSKTVTERRFQDLQRKAGNERTQLVNKTKLLQSTIDTQKVEINKIKNERFETVQGEIRYIVRGGRNGTQIVSINLGSADALRPGITFGVIDRDETTRLQDANVKASIQVTAIRGPHLAEARVVKFPKTGNPIIEGDAVYSPFWAPGRTVRIALAGSIDTDGDDKPDNEALEGMIIAAGAQPVKNEDMDAGVRFLVVGEAPELKDTNDESTREKIQSLGESVGRARELGVTVIPAWKLEAYLRTLDDSLTTPLGSIASGDDFPPDANPSSSRRYPSLVAPIYMKDDANVQTDNEIAKP